MLSWRRLYLKIVPAFLPHEPLLASLSTMGPVDPSVEISGKNTGLLLVMKECIGYYMWQCFV